MNSNFVPQRSNLGQQVYDYLVNRIYRMEIAPGTRLGVGDVAEQLGVSRSPVRDAFRMLVAEGVVELLPTGRYCVLQLTRKYVEDVFVMHRALELAAVGLSVQHLDRERAQRLRKTWGDLKDARSLGPQALELHHSADQELHQSIAEMSQNTLLKDALDKIIPLAALLHRRYYASDIPHQQLQIVAEEHLRVLDAMLAGEAEHAIAALDEHLTHTYARILERLDAPRSGTH